MNITVNPPDNTNFLGDLRNGSFFEYDGAVYIVTGFSQQYQVRISVVPLRWIREEETYLISKTRVRKLTLIEATFG